MAERGGVCVLIGEYCCTFIPGHTSPEGVFTKAMKKLRTLRMELTESAGRDVSPGLLGWFEDMMGGWKQGLFRLGLTVLVCVVIMGFLVCCCIPVMRSVLIRRVEKQMLVLAREPPVIPDLFPKPDWENAGELKGEPPSDDDDDD